MSFQCKRKVCKGLVVAMTKTQVSKAFFIVTDTKKLFQDSSPRFNYNSFNQLELTFPHISLWDSFDCMEYFCDEKPSVWWCIPSQIGTWRGIASWRIEFERETIASTKCGLSSCNSKLKLTWNMETEIDTWTARSFTIFNLERTHISWCPSSFDSTQMGLMRALGWTYLDRKVQNTDHWS